MIDKDDVVSIINEWNPAGIYPLLQDEYTLEVKMIMDVVSNNECISENQLGIEIDKIFLYAFNSPLVYKTNTMKCIEIASIILEK